MRMDKYEESSQGHWTTVQLSSARVPKPAGEGGWRGILRCIGVHRVLNTQVVEKRIEGGWVEALCSPSLITARLWVGDGAPYVLMARWLSHRGNWARQRN